MSLPNVVDVIPDGVWMRRLQEGHWIWLVKEQQYASVCFPWQPSGLGRPGWVGGRLVLNKFTTDGDGDTLYRANSEVWYVGGEGQGFDGKQLIMPCEGYLPETFVEIADQNATNFRRTLENLTQRLRVIEQRIRALEQENQMFKRVLEFPFHRRN